LVRIKTLDAGVFQS